MHARHIRPRTAPRHTTARRAAIVVALALSLIGGAAAHETNWPATDFPSAAARRVSAQVQPAHVHQERALRVASVEALGVVTIPTGTRFEETVVGGWSGITWLGAHGGVTDEGAEATTYLALSDDRSQTNPARFYRLAIDPSDGTLEPNDVAIEAVTTLRDSQGQAYPAGGIDPEGIALTAQGTLVIASEGDARAGIGPSITEHGLDGRALRSLPVRSHFEPTADGAAGIRNNLAFESLAVDPRGRMLYTASEAALAQDGPVATVHAGSPARVAAYDLRTRQPGAEWVYPISPVPVAPDPPDAFADNGLPELLALDEAGTLLALERSYAAGVGNTIRLFETSTQGARDVSDIDALAPVGNDPTAIEGVMVKRQVADLAALSIRPDNVEGMTFGPDLADGRRLLILVSDNNFNPLQVTQVIALALQLDEVAPPTPIPTSTSTPVPEPEPTPRLFLPRLLHQP